MRYVYLLLLVVIMSGCAHGRLRLRKVDTSNKVEIAEVPSKKKRTSEPKNTQTIVEISEEEAALEKTVVASEEIVENETASTLDAPESISDDSKEEITETLDDEPSKEQKARRALIAENDARKAKTAFIWSMVLLFSAFVPFLAIISPFSIIPFIIGSIKLSQSNRSDYITPQGERDARSARIMQLIYAVFMALALIFVVAVLIIFVF